MKIATIVLLWVALALIVQGCSAMPARAEEKSQSIVKGTVTDLTCPRTEPVFGKDAGDVKEATYCMYVDGIRYPVTAEAWATSANGNQVILDCSGLPCKLEGK